jgi:hypothetical protein
MMYRLYQCSGTSISLLMAAVQNVGLQVRGHSQGIWSEPIMMY